MAESLCASLTRVVALPKKSKRTQALEIRIGGESLLFDVAERVSIPGRNGAVVF